MLPFTDFPLKIRLNPGLKGELVIVIPDEEEELISPMPPASFQELIENLKEESFSDDKLNIVKQAAKYNYFSVNQVLQIMETFDFDNDKVEAVRILYPRIIDKENAFKLQNGVTHSSSKEEINKIVSVEGTED